MPTDHFCMSRKVGGYLTVSVRYCEFVSRTVCHSQGVSRGAKPFVPGSQLADLKSIIVGRSLER